MSGKKLVVGTKTKFNALDKKVFELGDSDITLFSQLYFDITPMPWQHEFNTTPQKDKLVVAGIRSGKTFNIALGFVHFATFNPGARLLNASISSDQSQIVFQDVMGLVNNPRYAHWIEGNPVRHPYPVIKFINGAEIWFRSASDSGNLLRGWEFDWANLDEGGYTTELTVKTIKGRLLGRNKVTDKPRFGLFTCTTTPKGRGTWLYDRWKKGALKPDGTPEFPDQYNGKLFYSVRAKTSDNVYLDKSQVDEYRQDLTLAQAKQELEGDFLVGDNAVFNRDHIEYMYDPTHFEVAYLDERVQQWLQDNHYSSLVYGATQIDYFALEPELDHRYIISWDVGLRTAASGRNATVGGVFDITTYPYRLVGYRYFKAQSWTQVIELVKEWHLKYRAYGNSQSQTWIDSTGKGDVINEILATYERTPIDGIVYTQKTKENMIHALQLMLERGALRAPFLRQMVDQLEGYELMDKKIAQDIVMMLAQFAYVMKDKMNFYLPTSHSIVAAVTGGRRGKQEEIDPRSAFHTFIQQQRMQQEKNQSLRVRRRSR